MGTRVLSGKYSGRGVMLATHHHTGRRCRMSGVEAILPLYICLDGVHRDKFTFTFYQENLFCSLSGMIRSLH